MAYKYGFCDGFSDALCGSNNDSSSKPPIGKTLGCSKHVAYVQNKCNGRRLCELVDASVITYTRILDDVSSASVIVPISGDMDTPCCSCLATVEPWCHQLTIVREGDGVVWTGPIQKVTYGRDQVVIEARDKLAWLQYRINELTLDYSKNGPALSGDPPNPPPPYIPMTEIAHDIMIVAMAEDEPNNSPCFLEDAQGHDLIIIPPGINGNLSDGLPPDFGRQFKFDAFAGPTALDDLNQLAGAGIDYTVVGQNVILTGEDLPPKAIGILTDEMILGDVNIIKDGTTMGNRFFVRWEAPDDTHGGDDDAASCQANCNAACSCVCPACTDTNNDGVLDAEPCYFFPCPGHADIPDDEIGCYGRLERVIDGLGVTNAEVANQIAAKYVEREKIAPRLLELPSGTRLSPICPWEINDIIPGQRIDVAISTLCLEIFESFKIQGMEVTDDGTEEVITVDLQSARSFD